jgi:hypothetical protein
MTWPSIEEVCVVSNILVALVATTQAPGAEVDAAQFARLMAGLHADIRDVTLVYEGKISGVPRGSSVEDVLRGGITGQAGINFQGSYSFRADGSSRIDSFVSETHEKEERQTQRTLVLFAHQLGELTRFPDRRNEKGVFKPGAPGSLNAPGAPTRIIYLWFFQGLTDPAAKGYEYQGWEEIEGHQCLRVQFDEAPGSPERRPDRPIIRFWIDMSRGGHPLKVEFAGGFAGEGGVRMRSTGIKLARLPLDDEHEVWFPVSGWTESFTGPGGRSSSRALGIETYYVVDGTVRFNRGLPDDYFSLDWKGRLPETPGLAQRRRDFRKPVRRNDPAGIKKRLDEQLREADAQAEQIEASSPAKVAEGWTILARGGLIAFGILLVCGAGIWRWRRR